MRIRELETAVKRFGISLETGSKHWKWRRESDGKVYPMPGGNGKKTEIPPEYLRGFCRCFGLAKTDICN